MQNYLLFFILADNSTTQCYFLYEIVSTSHQIDTHVQTRCISIRVVRQIFKHMLYFHTNRLRCSIDWTITPHTLELSFKQLDKPRLYNLLCNKLHRMWDVEAIHIIRYNLKNSLC